MRSLVLAVLLLPACASARAAKLATGDFLNLPVDVRSLGMGEASQALAAGADEVSVNPAAVDAVRAQQFYFTHAFLYQGVGADYLSYGLSRGPHHFGLSYYHVGYGELEGHDVNGAATGNFGPSDTAYAFSYGTDIGPVDVGGTFKYVDSKIVTEAKSPTFDAGAHYRVNSDWAVGLSGANLGGGLKYDAQSAPLPTRVSAGVGWRALEGLWLALDVVNPIYSPSYVAMGSEYLVPIKGVGSLAVRLGVNTKTPDLGALAGLKAGIGFKFKALDIDYALSTGGDLGQAHHLGVGYRFGGDAGDQPEKSAENERDQDNGD